MSFRVAILWRGTQTERSAATLESGRFAGAAAALRAAGLAVEPCVYAEEFAPEVEATLARMDAVLVWVNPIQDGRDRSDLDPMLRRLAEQGVLVSAHPDAILAMGTKEVLYQTRALPFGSDVRLYRDLDALRAFLPSRLAGATRVLKQNRGHSGIGIWLVEPVEPQHPSDLDMKLRVREAPRDSKPEVVALRDFVARCAPYFANGGIMVDQPYVARLPEGMIRCYLIGTRIGGFGHQAINALLDQPPGPRLYSGPDDPRFQHLRRLMEQQWVGLLRETLGLAPESLPVLWDVDFLLGPKTADGQDSYVLCEINVSSVSPFPESAYPLLAEETLRRLRHRATPPNS